MPTKVCWKQYYHNYGVRFLQAGGGARTSQLVGGAAPKPPRGNPPAQASPQAAVGVCYDTMQGSDIMCIFFPTAILRIAVLCL